MFKAMTLALTLFLVACGAQDQKPKVKMGDRARAKERSKEERKSGGYHGYQIKTPEELFASRFSKADLSCDVFAVDQEKLDPNEKATAVIVIPLVPTLIQTKDVTVTTPSKAYQVYVKILEVNLATFDSKVNDKIAAQAPVVDVIGELTITKLVEKGDERISEKLKPAPDKDAEKKIGFGAPIMAELDEDIPMANLGNSKALGLLRCKVLSTPVVKK
jgi:hypothetical protein